MSNTIKLNPLKPYSRSVSIIGVGCTPFMKCLKNPETEHLGEGEMFGSACVEAMRDAGVNAKDVDYYFHTQALPALQSSYCTPAAQMGNWIGMRGKANSHHSEACCSGFVALEQAVMAVSSGVYDMVLSGGCDMSYSRITPGRPSFDRQLVTHEEFFTNATLTLMDHSYAAQLGGTMPLMQDAWMEQYRQENHLTNQQIDDMLCNQAIKDRYAAVLNPLGLPTKTYEEEAAEVGLDAEAYLHSDQHNPRETYFMRASGHEARCDGAAAVLVCPTEMAYKYTDHPIEVLGIGHSVCDTATPFVEKMGTMAAYNQVKEFTGLTGADMDLFLTNDFFANGQMLSAEACEYLPKGEGWKYTTEFKTAYDGERPVNTSGGRCHYGHAHGSSGLADVYEATKQLRGEMGATQIKGDPKRAMLRGFGGGQNFIVAILQKL